MRLGLCRIHFRIRSNVLSAQNIVNSFSFLFKYMLIYRSHKILYRFKPKHILYINIRSDDKVKIKEF